MFKKNNSFYFRSKFNNVNYGRLFTSFLLLYITGCTDSIERNRKISNKGHTIVENGRGEMDSLIYSCDSCYEILTDKSVFDTLIDIASQEAKDGLRNKLSFKPMSIDIKVWKADSVFYTSGRKIDSLVIAYSVYKCIGKNGYGVEDEVEKTGLIYFVNNKPVDLSGKILKDSLLISDNTVSRTLSLYDEEGGMEIQPVMLGGRVHLIVTTDESCVEGARLRILFEDKSSISLTSWNDFNCKSISYFRFSKSDLEALGNKRITFISYSEDKSLFCQVPENEIDYFIQYVKLIQKKDN